MRSSFQKQVLEFVKRSRDINASALAEGLGISRQAVHRHLRVLEAAGLVAKFGMGPNVRYRLANSVNPIADLCRDLKQEFSKLPEVKMLTLFGSYSRGTANHQSDVDIMVWLDGDALLTRNELWSYFDRISSSSPWRDKVSLITVKLKSEMPINTLILDLPEEHKVIFDRNNNFPRIKKEILKWRIRNGAKKLPSFGGTHAWLYSDKNVTLNEIDFTLRLKNVA